MNRIVTRTRRLSCALAALLLFTVAAAKAQTGLYGEFNASHLNLPDSHWGYGGLLGIYSDFAPFGPVKVGGDLRASFLRVDPNTNLTSVLFGPRVALHLHGVPVTPYAEGLIGPGHFSYGNNSPSTNQFEYQVMGGVDRGLLPHLDWRIAEVSYSGLNTYAGHLHPITVSTGIVLRFR